MRPGIKTSELWLTVATNVGLLASALAQALPPRWAAIGSAVATACYALSRGLTKGGASAPAASAVAIAPPEGR
jgi:hypothetical protein